MADNTLLNTGTGGDTMRTKDRTGVKTEIVGLDINVGGAEVLATGDATYGMDVDVTRVIPGTAATELGKAEDAAHTSGDVGVMALAVRQDTIAALAGTTGDYTPITTSAEGIQYVQPIPKMAVVTVTSDGLTTSATAYTAGDNLDNVHTATGFARSNGRGGVIRSVTLLDAADVIGACDIYVYDTTVTLTDNAAHSVSDAENLTCLGVIQLPGALDSALNRMSYARCDLPFVCTGSSTSLFFALVTRSAHTFFGAATNVAMRFVVEQY